MDDLISRQAAIDAIKKDVMGGLNYEWIIKKLPSIQPEQKTGWWKIVGEEVGALGIRYQIKQCSECGWKHSLLIPEDFCPNCGAKMEGDTSV